MATATETAHMHRTPLDENWDQSLRKSSFRLRFELGGGYDNIEQPVPRFIQAFHRAQTIANELFSNSEPLTGILAYSPLSKDDMVAPAPDALGALRALGFAARKPWCQWVARLSNPDDPDEDSLNWRAIDLDDKIMRDTLLWTAIAYEMPIRPKAPVLTFLVDFDAMVSLHVYDDRGMDVTSLAPDRLEPLYRKFDGWLLDYDRPRMAAAFGD
jgi:hypothetical protein